MRFSSHILLLLIPMIFPLLAHAQTPEKIGIVLLTKGDVKAIGKDGISRPLSRRSDIYLGDNIKVAKEAIAQLRFSDNSLLTLKRDAELSLDEYKNKGEPNDRFKASLKKGAMRTKTGNISKSNSANYGIKTPVAVMGVRGTLYSCDFSADTNQLNCAYFVGAGYMENAFGRLPLGIDESYNFGSVSADTRPDGALQQTVDFDDEEEYSDVDSSDLDFEDDAGVDDDSFEEWDTDIDLMSDEEFDDFDLDFEEDFYFDEEFLLDEGDYDFFYDEFYDPTPLL